MRASRLTCEKTCMRTRISCNVPRFTHATLARERACDMPYAWLHGDLHSLILGSLAPWPIGSTGSVAPWIIGSLAPLAPRLPGSLAPLAPRLLGSMAPWPHGDAAPWLPGTMAPWFHGTMDPWLPGDAAPWLPGSMALVSRPVNNVFSLARCHVRPFEVALYGVSYGKGWLIKHGVWVPWLPWLRRLLMATLAT